jgi:hypothetical protein
VPLEHLEHAPRVLQRLVAVHIGGEYDVLPKRLTLRAGYLFESSSMPDETISVLTPDGDKHLLSLGLSVRLGGGVGSTRVISVVSTTPATSR